jgi:CDP-diacylglycerol pyrophosphatase
VVAFLVVTFGCAETHLASATETRPPPDALWQIVSTCFDAGAADARSCACPAMIRSCCGDAFTPGGAVVWAETASFVAIRDMKMCGCPADFVAGLALPRKRVGGIEDPARPEGIWPFAWGVARGRIADPLEIGLVINPADARSQNQMHVHMLRLKPGIRAAIDQALASGHVNEPAPAIVVRLPDLERVFAAVAARVADASLRDRGILVATTRDGAFAALVTDGRSPQAFTWNTCRP